VRAIVEVCEKYPGCVLLFERLRKITPKGGGDPVEGLRRHADRIWHVHFKDHDPRVAEQSRPNEWDAIRSVEHGVFCELGRGGNEAFFAIRISPAACKLDPS
jgi:hypothetical protein